jgi:hypothetical protein
MNYSRDPSYAAEAPGDLSRPERAAVRAGSRNPGISPWLFVMVTALNTMVAAILAVLITLGVVRQERADGQQREMTSASTAATRSTVGASRPAQPIPTAQPIDLRPIGSPQQPLRLEARKAARLPLQIEPEDAGGEPFILVLSGAPAGTTLAGAAPISSDSWFLSPGSAERLEIAVPEWSTSVFDVGVALRRTNGLVAAQTRAWIAVPPPASLDAAGSRIDDATAKDLLAKADRLLATGDIVAARAVYQRLAEMGSGLAAMTLGSTYDPKRLWSLGAFGMVGNKERAKQWYARASELGYAEAKARLISLGN